MGEASSQPDRAPSHRGHRAGRSSVLTPPFGLPLFPSRHRRQAEEPPPQVPSPIDERLSTPPPGVGDPKEKLCRCGHAHAAHEHYRRGSDCGVCGVTGCAAYVRASSRMRP